MIRIVILNLLAFTSIALCSFITNIKYKDDPAVKLLQEYIQIDTLNSKNLGKLSYLI